MASQRIERVQNLLRSEISMILLRKIKDPRVRMVTVTEVDASPDLKQARVWVSVLGDDRDDVLAGLKSAAGFIRSELMRVLHLRPMPVLSFEFDRALERGARTLDLLDRLHHEQEDSSSLPGSGDKTDSQQ
ncbi:MAG: 30S ribosome-binding factor RbfA [Armatimonadetes bacterium]|nr:30S ribosome-binding factor RbfA [Armatimonadota bacterium]